MKLYNKVQVLVYVKKIKCFLNWIIGQLNQLTTISQPVKAIISLRGPSGRGVFDLAKVEIEFFVVSDSYQMLFTESKNIVPSQSYQILKSGKYG